MRHIIYTTIFLAVIILALSLYSYLSNAETQQADLYSDIPLDMRLLQLDKRALDEAYHQSLLKLWAVWLQGGAQEPKFFQNGLGNARRAYNQAAKQISERESILFEKEQQRIQEQQLK